MRSFDMNYKLQNKKNEGIIDVIYDGAYLLFT